MRRNEPIFHVFLSYAAEDVDLANEAAQLLADRGLTAFRVGGIESGQHVWDRVSEVLAESAAVICLFRSEPGPSSSVAMELGAAVAWSKPVFLVTPNGPLQRPRNLWGFNVYDWQQWPNIIQQIKSIEHPLTNDEQQLLERIYRKRGVTVDRIMLSPGVLDTMTRDFNKQSARPMTGERLLQSLLRRRKLGELPRIAKHRRTPKTPETSGSR